VTYAGYEFKDALEKWLMGSRQVSLLMLVSEGNL